MTCRKRIDDVETGEMSLPRDKSGGWPDCCPDDIRHEGGVKLSQALAWNVGTCPPMRRETSKWEAPMRIRVPMRGHRGGATCSRAEGSIMGPDRRGCIVQLWTGVNQQWEEPHG
jgi:hypothetical protein